MKPNRPITYFWNYDAKAAKNLCVMLGSGMVLINELHEIDTVEELDLLLFISDYIEPFCGGKGTENYINYQNREEAQDAYEKSARWLFEHNIHESICMLAILVCNIKSIEYYCLHDCEDLICDEDFREDLIEKEALIYDMSEALELDGRTIREIISSCEKYVKMEIEAERGG